MYFSSIEWEPRRSVQRSKWASYRKMLEEVELAKPFSSHFDRLRGNPLKVWRLQCVRNREGEEAKSFKASIRETVGVPFFSWWSGFTADEEIHVETHPHDPDIPEFSHKEIKPVFRTGNREKAPGLEWILMEVIELVYRVNRDLFKDFFNKCLMEGNFPLRWKKANLVLFKKVDKDRFDASSYCPICPLTAWSKVLDKLVTRRLDFHAQSRGFFHLNQFSFIPEKSIENTLHDVQKTVNDCHTWDMSSYLIMLDVKGDFNNLWCQVVYAELGRRGCPRNIYRLLRSFLSDR